MKKALIIIMLALMVIASCTEQTPEGKGTMRITISEEKAIASGTIKPADYPLEIVSYRITGSGPDGAEFIISTDHTSESVDNVAYGLWTLTAEGLNEEKDAIARGSVEFAFSPKNQNALITIDELIGEGSLSVDISWDASSIIGTPSVRLQLAKQYGDKETAELSVTVDESAGTATYSGSGHESGSYTLSAQLFDDDVQVAGCTVAVRIANGQESHGTIEFDLENEPIEPGSMIITNATGVPVTLTMEGIDTDTIPAAEAVTVSMKAENDEAENYNILWYLNGTEIGSGPSITFTPSVGIHRLDVVASSSKIGSTSSTAVTFEAIAAGKPGTPDFGGIIKESENLKMGDDMIIRFLDNGSVLIASNEHRMAYIGRLVRNDINIEKKISYTSLGLSSSTISDIAMKPVGSAYTAVFALNNPIGVKYYTYDQDAMAFSCYFTETGPWTYKDLNMTDALFAGLSTNPLDAVLVAANDAGTDARMIPFHITTSASGNSRDDVVLGASSIWMEGSIPIVYEDGPDGYMGVSEDGYMLYGYRDGLKYTSASLIGIQSELDSTIDAAIVGHERVLHLGNSLSLIDAHGMGNIIHSESLGGSEAAALTVSKDYEFAYYIDITENQLVTLSLDVNGASWEELERTDLPEDNLDEMIISPSGRNLMLFDKDNTDRIVLMRISHD